MFRVYFVKETEYGLEISGPNGHRWCCTKGETKSRAAGYAKSLERAYLEGQKSISQDVPLAITLEALSELASVAGQLDPETLRERIIRLAEKAEQPRRKLDKIRALNAQQKLKEVDGEATDQRVGTEDTGHSPA